VADPKLYYKKPPSVDLSGHIEVCEMNYHRLLGMLPGLNQGVDLWRFQAGSDADIDIAFDGHRNWQSQYAYPNPKMYQPDEKQALNRFLADWLVFCRKHGLAHRDNCESVLVSRKT